MGEDLKTSLSNLVQSLEVHMVLQSVATQIFVRQNTELVKLITTYKENIRKLEDRLEYLKVKEKSLQEKPLPYERNDLDAMMTVIKSQEMEIVAMRREIKYLSRKNPDSKQKRARTVRVVSFK